MHLRQIVNAKSVGLVHVATASWARLRETEFLFKSNQQPRKKTPAWVRERRTRREQQSFNRLVEAREQHRRNVEPQRLRGLEIDHKLELGRLLNRQVGGLLPLEDAIDVTGRLPALVGGVTPYDIKPPLVSRTACGTL
jgi:hypothetical protein